jgi:hypothetical protein
MIYNTATFPPESSSAGVGEKKQRTWSRTSTNLQDIPSEAKIFELFSRFLLTNTCAHDINSWLVFNPTN